MKFRYNGDCDNLAFRGISFPICEAVEVSDPATIAKLRANSHFDEVKTRKRKVSNGDNSGNKKQGGV